MGFTDLLFLGLLAVHVIPRTGLLALILVAKILSAILGVVYCFVPYQKHVQEDMEFSRQTSRNLQYQPEYQWASSNAKVLMRYSKAVSWKEVTELSVKSSRYMALQRQINPHFLYNTLDAIRSDMIIEGNLQIAETVEALSKYFAYAVSNMDQMATISEELNNVRDYFAVQKYRFEDRLSLEIINDADETMIQDICIPRLTIQPVIENAITHGLETSQENGKITVHMIPAEQNLTIHVIDNGVGMDRESLNQLNERLRRAEPQSQKKQRGGIALINVNSRIKLLCGEDYGLHVFSMQGIGTDVHICLPLEMRDCK